MNTENLNVEQRDTFYVRLGARSFANCENFKYIKKSNVREIADDAFKNNPILSSVILSNDEGIIETYGGTTIRNNVFENDSSLEFFYGKYIKSLGNNVFCNCSSLSNIYIESGELSIGNCCFDVVRDNAAEYGYKNIKLFINSPIFWIGAAAFNNIRMDYSSLPLMLATNNIDPLAFSNSELKIDLGLLSSSVLSGSHFSGLDKMLTILNWPYNLEKIESGVFTCYYGSLPPQLPETLKYIGASAFDMCMPMKNAVENDDGYELPPNIEYIGTCAFGSDTRPKLYISNPDNEYYTTLFNNLINKKLNRIDILLWDNIQDINNTMQVTSLGPCSVRLIETSLTIPNYIEEIDEIAFNCWNMVADHCNVSELSIFFEGYNTVGEIENKFGNFEYHCHIIPIPFFEFNESETEVAITSITNAGLDQLNLIIPSEFNGKPVTSIDNNVFESYNGLKITIPSSVSSFGNLFDLANEKGIIIIFRDRSSWYDINEDYGLSSPCVAIFEPKLLFREYEDHAELVEITNYGKSIRDISIPSEFNGKPVTVIGNNAYKDYNRVNSITIPSSVTSIGDGAFSNCMNLETVTIPESVTSIGENVFDNCKRLISVKFNKMAYIEEILEKDFENSSNWGN